MENDGFLIRARQTALECGFSNVGELRGETLVPRHEVRSACSSDKCKAYGKNWSCPPACGTLEECETKFRAYQQGLLLQTTGKLEDDFDWENIQKTSMEHSSHLRDFASALSAIFAESAAGGDNRLQKFLLLGAGACTFCKACSYPDSPCRFPDNKIVSMEAMGLVVSDTCAANNIPYYYGPNTMTYVGCVLF
jgi:predicted metal-binding protein